MATSPLTADQLNAIAASSGYTGGKFGSTGLSNTSTISNAALGLPDVNGSINSGNLKPETPMNVASPQPSSEAAGLGGAIQGAVTDPYTASLAASADAAKTGKDQSLQDLISAMGSFQGKESLTNDAYAKTVDPAQKELNDVNQQLTAEQVANRHQIEALQNAPAGFVGQGLANRVNDINSKSLLRQADLAVVQLAKQGAYDSAKAIADRAVAVTAEAEQNKINALQLNYENNKDTFTTAEQRSFEAAQKSRQDALDEQTYEARAKYDQMIKQSDPLYQAQVAHERSLGLSGAGDSAAFDQISAAKGADGYTDPNLYAKLRAASKLSPTDFDNRYGYLVNPLSAPKLGITASTANNAGFGALTPADQTKGMNWLMTQNATQDDLDKFQSDRGFQAWVLSQTP